MTCRNPVGIHRHNTSPNQAIHRVGRDPVLVGIFKNESAVEATTGGFVHPRQGGPKRDHSKSALSLRLYT
ncbi:MAG: hypothetical protein JWO52_1950 [Gammaproteobacteria bacterium]|jgi:hypothetical protein|nr:hypothetical protein [Gammaproteobacteria bacterium]